jgi:hypothetical protein
VLGPIVERLLVEPFIGKWPGPVESGDRGRCQRLVEALGVTESVVPLAVDEGAVAPTVVESLAVAMPQIAFVVGLHAHGELGLEDGAEEISVFSSAQLPVDAGPYLVTPPISERLLGIAPGSVVELRVARGTAGTPDR